MDDCGECRCGRGRAGWKGNRGRPLQMRHETATMEITSADAAVRDGCGHAVADEAMGAGGDDACHFGRGHIRAVDDASDVPAELPLRTRPRDSRGKRE